MIVGNPDIVRFALDEQFIGPGGRVVGERPSEANAPLIIDPDAVFTGLIATKSLEAIRWRVAKLDQARHALQLGNSSRSLRRERLELANSPPGNERGGSPITVIADRHGLAADLC